MRNRISEHEPDEWKAVPQFIKNLPGLTANTSRDWLAASETFIKGNPGAALMVAFFAGATVAWWLKRR